MIFLVSNVHGIGLAPASSRFDFKSNSVQEGRFRIIADEVPSKIILTTEGDLGEFIELEKDVLVMEEKEQWVSFKINMPEDMNPGERRGGILALNVPKDTTRENVVIATTAIVHQVKVNVPYPGKYLTGKLYVTNTKVQDDIIFTIALANWGKEDINNVKGTISIKGPTNEELAVLHTNEISMKANEESKLLATWNTEHEGSYFAQVIVEYDGTILELSKPFSVGSLDIEIERIAVDNFKIGQIAKLDIYLRNKWNEPVRVDGRVEVFEDNKMISSFNTAPVDVGAQSTDIMSAYWNTEGVETGEYDIVVKANYKGKTSERLFNSIVSIDDIQFKDFISGKAISSKGKNNTPLLVGAVIILIILNILLFIYINKKLKTRNI